MANITDFMQIDRRDDGDAVALIRPEQVAEFILALPKLTPDTEPRNSWKRNMEYRFMDNDNAEFYGQTPPEAVVRQILTGELTTPPREVDTVSDMIAADLANLGTRNRRTRHHAEDGEINISRWIDDRDRCFTRRRRTPKPFPIVNVIANFCFNCHTPLKAFQNQATILTATCKTLESIGFSTNVFAAQITRTSRVNHKRHILIPLKSAGTPLNAAQVWTYTRREVSRRIYHNLTAALCYAMNDKFDYSLGHCDWMRPTLYADLLPGTSLIFEAGYETVHATPETMAQLIKQQIDDAKIIAQDEGNF